MQNPLAIILVNWNSYALTADCLQSLARTRFRNYDVIVVDNGSADGSPGKLREAFPHVILLEAGQNLGFAGGNNIGLRYALEKGYTYAMLLNNDTFVEPDFLEPLLQFMEQHPHAGAVQPKIFYHHDRSLIWNGGTRYDRWFGNAVTTGFRRRDTGKYDTLKEVDWITGCAFLVRTEALRQVGLLNEKFFIYYEDTDLSMRLRKAGYRLFYIPQSVIYHIAGMANRSRVKTSEGYQNPIVHYLNVRNKIWFLRKYTAAPYAPSVFMYNAAYFSAMLAYFTLRRRFKKMKAVLRGIRDGLLTSG